MTGGFKTLKGLWMDRSAGMSIIVAELFWWGWGLAWGGL